MKKKGISVPCPRTYRCDLLNIHYNCIHYEIGGQDAAARCTIKKNEATTTSRANNISSRPKHLVMGITEHKSVLQDINCLTYY